MVIKRGMPLNGGAIRQIEKETDAKNIPAADHGDEENWSGHSFPKANCGKGMNGDNPAPRFTLSESLSPW
jgi:hypothetical protein